MIVYRKTYTAQILNREVQVTQEFTLPQLIRRIFR
jgi:hypothetical protein